jgi:hypothetical protein
VFIVIVVTMNTIPIIAIIVLVMNRYIPVLPLKPTILGAGRSQRQGVLICNGYWVSKVIRTMVSLAMPFKILCQELNTTELSS